MIRAEVEVEINRPPEEVFDLWADMRNDKDWHPSALGVVEKTSPGPLGIGTTFRGEYRGTGVVTEETTAYERPHKLGRRGVTKNFRVESTFTFTPTAAGGTLLKARGSVEPIGWMKLMEPLMGLMRMKQLASVMNALKHTVESRVR
ncbi:MAG: SRPBCC family protein [Anaerolineae bacterium]|nr:SRPBCC family protein [Anaerolineae bacterium]MCI0611009.1 SRPBCC family protein [Anaerolineae bacterium]